MVPFLLKDKIRQGMRKFISDQGWRGLNFIEAAEVLTRCLDSLGVVVRVEMELPTVQRNLGRDTYGNMRETQQDMLKAGYTATERLIEEGK